MNEDNAAPVPTVLVVGDPPWKEFKHRPSRANAFRWDFTMGEIIPQIHKEGDGYVLANDWDVDVPLTEGIWIVQAPTGEVWCVDKDKFDRWYESV